MLEAQVILAFRNIERLRARQKFADLSIVDSETLLVQMPKPSGASSTGDNGTSPLNHDFIKLTSEDYKSLNVLSPSKFANPSEYMEMLQPTKVGTALYMLNRPMDPNRVPIALLSEVFARFEVNFHEGRKAPYGPTVFEAVRQLMYGLASLYGSEADLQTFVNKWLTRHFNVTLQARIGTENSRASDEHDTIETSHGVFLTFVSVGKSSLGGGSGDPTIQGMCYFREFYRQRATDFPQYGGCRPALLLVYAGHVIGVYGLVMHKDGTVQMEPLTWIMTTDCDWTNGKHKRWFYRFVSALDQAIKDLREYYQQPPPNPSESYDYALQNPPHDAEDRATKKMKLSAECWFPYPRSYANLTGEGKTSFTFEGRMFQDRLVFTAIENESQKRIVIKFTERYARAVHKFLAENGLAPALYGCEDVLEGLQWTMVAMEYLPLTDWVPMASKSRAQQKKYGPKIKDALQRLWREGWVHGDVRHHNILVPLSDEEIDIRFIDFDYCGRAGKDRYPPDWNHTFRPADAVGGALMNKEHDEAMFDSLFVLTD